MRSRIFAQIWLVLAASAAVSGPATADDHQACLKASTEPAAATIAACTRAIESGDYRDQDLSALYHTRGCSWSRTNLADHVDRSLKDFTEAIRIDPKAAGSRLNRAHIYNQRRQYDQAIADANDAFESGLSDYGKRAGYGERGYAYQAKGDNDRAIADYTESLRLDANNSFALTARGNAYFAKGNFDRAIADYDRVIALDPDYAHDYSAYSSRAIAYLSRGDFRGAIADFDRGQALSWLAAAAFFAVVIWLCCRRDAQAPGRWSGPTIVQMCENELVESKRRNAALESIAAALEKRSSG
ncbi:MULTISPECIES: tetratricopeptide repeat protein [unclassified Bradyrhizobium]|uniref:tetratricopeptide repeat protein n=1 Tax=unclassified Bradyrhizobium TaxID=2631580 RepID=UPI001FF84CB5|nr:MULTISPECIES: tetratricopeptide repeat protein [unclassified Bradyrhizobium]MCK1523875.1 tetratricopeptide repeat protein [Bradyrhizobium sp. 17]MCK1574532.1 tetratricopeptide repeat protein [Bradyrhizobium sp. 174]